MSTAPSLLKKPKAEPNNDDDNEPVEKTKPMSKSENGGGGGGAVDGEMPEEDSIVALIEHRTREVEHLKKKISYYKSQLVEAEKRLRESHEQLARVRARRKAVPSETASENGTKIVQLESRSTSPIHVGDGSTNQPQCKTELVIPAVNPKSSQPVKSLGSGAKAPSGPGPRSSPVSHSYTIAKVKPEKTDRSSSGVEVVEVEERGRKRKLEHKDRSSPVSHSHTIAKIKPEKTDRSSSDAEAVEVEERGRKRKLEHKEHKELIPLVCSRLSPCTIHCHSSNHISSQHKRKMRSLAVCPVNDQLFVTSALDGVVNLWQIQSRGSAASLLSSTDCMSSKHRRWPEDIAWHPLGNSLFSIYTADGGDSQISVLNLNRTQGRARVTFLEDKPHVKGIINSIMFMPWENTCFVTGGSDHAVVLWNERDAENSWKPKVLHRNLHSSAVMGVAGIQKKQVILSAGADKRIIGFDAEVGRAEFRYHLDSKCMSVLPNPCDYNLFMAQTGTPLRQLRLFDIRLRQTEIHAFGFKQESSDSQSALINQAWSPDGLYLTSGSVDPVIHIFDIRYNSQKPSQSIRAHQKRVFKAVWHYSLPLLISISSDLHIGLHKIV